MDEDSKAASGPGGLTGAHYQPTLQSTSMAADLVLSVDAGAPTAFKRGKRHEEYSMDIMQPGCGERYTTGRVEPSPSTPAPVSFYLSILPLQKDKGATRRAATER